MVKRNPLRNKPKSAIRRFDIAVMQATYFNTEIAKYITTRDNHNPPGPVPPKLSIDRFKSLTELGESSQDVLLLFKKFRLDATPIFAYMMDSHLVRQREPFYDFPVIAMLQNLRLHATDETPVAAHRLQIQIGSESQVAILDGEQFPITKPQAMILKKLLDESGGFVAAWKLKTSKTQEARPDRIIKRMPKPIRALIRAKTGPHGGAALTLTQ